MAVSVLEVPEREPPFRRFGLGWQYRPPEAPVVMTFTSVSEKRGEVRAEVHVQSATNGGHMVRRYLNLLGSTSIKQLVGDLASADGGAGYPWAKILESATESIIRAVRRGPELETYHGELARPPGIRWLCRDLVMQDVPNVWLAAGSTGKSTLSVALAVCHALGMSFLGRETTKGVPLYLDWESTSDDFQEKLWLISRWLGVRGVPKIHRLRMNGPASAYAAALATRIDELGVSLVVWDGVQAAGGPIGAQTSYEAVAMELEALVGLLPLTTHLMLDHVTGDELKSGAVPLKGRGSTRKVEWARNQWTLSLDRDAQASKRHVVGWTHTKINRDAYLPAFGVEVLHRPDELGFDLVNEADVKPLHERMPTWRQILAVVQEAGRPLSNNEAARLWKGETSKKTMDLVRVTVSNHTRVFTRNADGTFEPHWETKARSNGSAVGATGTTAGAAETAEWPEYEPEYEDQEAGVELPF